MWAGQSTGKLLNRAFGDRQPVLAVVSAGCFPFWSKLPSIDMLGLNDEWIAKHPPADVGQGWAGHEFGDAGYVLRREPDLVQFSGIAKTGRTGYFRVERDLANSPDFQSRYMLVDFESTDPIPAVQALYVRRDSPRIGITRRGGETRVPAMLFAGFWRSRASLDADGRLGVIVAHDKPAVMSALALEPGQWRMETEPATDRLMIGARPAGATGDFMIIAKSGALPVEPGQRWDVVVAIRSETDSLRFHEVVFRRVAP